MTTATMGFTDIARQVEALNDRRRMSARTALRARPVTFVSIIVLATWMAVFGLALLRFSFTPTQLRVLNAGPGAVLDIKVWGWLFLAGAAVRVVSLWTFGTVRAGLSLGLHLIATLVALGWAASWFSTPQSLALLAYLFIAIMSVGLPYIDILARKFLLLIPRDDPER